MDIETRMRAAGRGVDPTEFAELSVQLAQQVARSRRRPLLRSRRRRLVALGAAGAVLLPGVAAAATVHFAAETGHYGPAGMTENDTSQYINMCAADFPSYVASVAPTTRPLPPGTSWEQLIRKVATPPAGTCPPDGPGGVEQVTGIKAQLLLVSTCPWEGEFLTAHANDDDAEMHRAGQQIASAEDAVDELASFGDDGWKRLRDGAARGDVTIVRQDYTVNCVGIPGGPSK